MKYDFDSLQERFGTGSLKWDVKENELPMWVADMDFPAAPEIMEVITGRAAHGIFGYSIVPDEWYQAYQGWWERRHHFRMERDWLLFCTGVVPAMSSIVRKMTTVGENVLIQTPVYNIFFNSVINNGRNVVENSLLYDGYAYCMDFEDLEEKLANPQTTMMILCNPQNPAGRIWDREELERVGKLCLKHHVLAVSDEIIIVVVSSRRSHSGLELLLCALIFRVEIGHDTGDDRNGHSLQAQVDRQNKANNVPEEDAGFADGAQIHGDTNGGQDTADDLQSLERTALQHSNDLSDHAGAEVAAQGDGDDAQQERYDLRGNDVQERGLFHVAFFRCPVDHMDKEHVNGHVQHPNDGAQQTDGNRDGDGGGGRNPGSDSQSRTQRTGKAGVRGRRAACGDVGDEGQLNGRANRRASDGITQDETDDHAGHQGLLDQGTAQQGQPGSAVNAQVVDNADQNGLYQ